MTRVCVVLRSKHFVVFLATLKEICKRESPLAKTLIVSAQSLQLTILLLNTSLHEYTHIPVLLSLWNLRQSSSPPVSAYVDNRTGPG